jgi:hypothetical protein
MTWYKVETRRATYRTYHVEADSPENADKKLSENLGGLNWYLDEWVGSEEVTSEDTEEIDEEEASIHTSCDCQINQIKG